MLISCVCPTRDRRQWIPVAIECFLAQTYTNSELVVLDNGSDDTESVVPVHPRIRYHRLPGPQLKTGAMRNAVNGLAHGEVICHWDTDDWSAPNRIESQLKQLQESGKQMVGCHIISFWDTNHADQLNAKHRTHQYRGTQPYACGTSQMYYKSYWETHRFNDQKVVGEDSDFSAEAKRNGQLASYDGHQMIVARARHDSTCPATFGGTQFPQVNLASFPAAFLDLPVAVRNAGRG